MRVIRQCHFLPLKIYRNIYRYTATAYCHLCPGAILLLFANLHELGIKVRVRVRVRVRAIVIPSSPESIIDSNRSFPIGLLSVS